MKERIFLFFILIGLCPLLINSQDSVMFDGRLWNKLSELRKLSYLMGYHDGALGIYLELDLKIKKEETEDTLNWIRKILDELSKEFTGGTYIQLMAGFDECYKDYTNTHIPICYLMKPLKRKITGKISKEEFEIKLQELRKWKER